MKKLPIVVSAVVLFALAGCSGKPTIGDVEDQVTDGWRSCNFVKPASFKKINGIDHGKTYEMDVSYKLEIVRDVPGQYIWIPEEYLRHMEQSNPLRDAALEKRHNFFATNCPGGIGDAFLKVAVANKKSGAPLHEGDTLDVEGVNFIMIKTDNGWVIR